jgi:hypothetical protein
MCHLGWHALLAGRSPGYECHTGHSQRYCLYIGLLCNRDFDNIRGEGMGYGGQDIWRQHDPAGVLGKWCFNNLPLRPWKKTKHGFERRRRLADLP